MEYQTFESVMSQDLRIVLFRTGKLYRVPGSPPTYSLPYILSHDPPKDAFWPGICEIECLTRSHGSAKISGF